MNTNNNVDPRTIECREKYVGQHYFTLPNKQGYQREFEILDYIDTRNVLIQFIGTDYTMKAPMHNIMTKGIRDPFETEHSCVVFDNNYQKYVGCYFRTNEGYFIQITDYKGISDVTIQFVYNGLVVEHCTIQNIKNGQIKNPFHPNKFCGYTGIGLYSTNEYRWLYRIWYNILIRCNDSEYYKKYHNSESYDNAILCEEWHCYNNFAAWYIGELYKLNPEYTYEIDKDLLYPYYQNNTNGHKFYSPETCLLIPQEINAVLSCGNLNKANLSKPAHVYIQERRNKLEKLAEYYYNNHAISSDVVELLKNFDLSIKGIDY